MAAPGDERGRLPRVSARSFTRIPTVMTGQEIIDSAFHRASKITVPNKDAFQRMKSTETARIRAVQNHVSSTLQKYVKRFPSFDGLSPFYQDLIGLLLDMDRVRKSLGTIDWAAKRMDEIGDEATKQIKSARFGEQILEAKGHAYGRYASILNQIDSSLRFLDEARRAMRKLPFIDAELPTIVIAGFPNVGKSSLVAKASTGKPEVANYPFTTKGVVLGHFEHRHIQHQIVDTPGLLDRPLDERNPIELQAILALRHLGDVIVFLIDSSEHCGYTVEAQQHLLKTMREAFPDTPFVIAEAKADIVTKGLGEIAVSAEKDENVKELIQLAISRMRPRA